jgi:ArsR family transcriptional regulator
MNVIPSSELAPLDQAGALFKALMHPARLAILQILRNGEQCVCHIEALLGLRQAYISQQLMVLRQAGLVTDRRDGWNIFYRVTRPELYTVLDAALQMVADPTHARSAYTLNVRCDADACPKCNAGKSVSSSRASPWASPFHS